MKNFLIASVMFVASVALLVFAYDGLSEYANPTNSQVDTSLFMP